MSIPSEFEPDHCEACRKVALRQPVKAEERPTIWCCAACGRTAPTREALKDSSCMTHGVLCWADSVVMGERVGFATKAVAVESDALQAKELDTAHSASSAKNESPS